MNWIKNIWKSFTDFADSLSWIDFAEWFNDEYHDD